VQEEPPEAPFALAGQPPSKAADTGRDSRPSPFSAAAGDAGRRRVLVSPERVAGWVDRFSQRHGPVGQQETDDGVLLTAADGVAALLQPPWPPAGRPGAGSSPAARVAAQAGQSRTAAVVLVRRGGYAIGLCRDGVVLASKVGTRYVQSRTAAGGWSQQRFARRRANQANALVRAVAEHCARVLRDAPRPAPEYLVLGGDRGLCRELLLQPECRFLAGLPQLEFAEVPDPRAAVLAAVARDLRAVRVLVTDPPTQSPKP
jgi:Actinobacteria/chloroflexi VLRF1 release factor